MDEFFFESMIELDQSGSTNLEAKKLLDEGFEAPFVIYSLNQSGGRGRLGNTWFSGKNAMALSMVLSLNCELFRIPYGISYLLFLFLKKRLSIKALSLKWPNDVFVNDKKIAGILIEKVENSYIIGVGLNVNHKKSEFKAAELVATSLFCETRKMYDIKTLSLDFISYTMEFLTTIIMDEKLIEKCLNEFRNYGKKIRCRVGKDHKIGFFQGIGKKGQLLLDCDGRLEEIWAGEIIE